MRETSGENIVDISLPHNVDANDLLSIKCQSENYLRVFRILRETRRSLSSEFQLNSRGIILKLYTYYPSCSS